MKWRWSVGRVVHNNVETSVVRVVHSVSDVEMVCW